MSVAEALTAQLAAAEGAAPAEVAAALRGVLAAPGSDADSLKVKEAALGKLTEVLVVQGDAPGLRALLSELRPLFAAIPKAKTAKIVRTVVDAIARVPGSQQHLLEVCKEQVEWATQEKRTFLRQRIEIRLAQLHMELKEYPAALALISKLLTEVKRLDDKLLLVDIHLLESKVHHALKNLPKSRAALTAARTAANAIYIPPSLQADIDSQSGTLHAEEKDYKTSYSYFFEAFEQLSALDDPRAVSVLKYMLLCKIMTGDVADVPAIIASKGGLKYAGLDVDAMRAVVKAYQDRSLQEFQATLQSYSAQLTDDPIVHAHLSALYDTLLEQNLIRLIEPFSRVEISHIASLIKLPLGTVEGKLSQMILDKKFKGTLDQGVGTLEVFEEAAPDTVYPGALETFGNLGRVVESLSGRSAKLTVGA
ncbi:26S proteasome non-ATPase regulatory subunit 11-like protein [Micractinium conductrix]|uniref:26S proteasome non-ATPase regulatory subunit 11-like protein n=1 Tax=Micractinium conductrix TaxID=554055 RepID=A0A2P6V0Y3_9CHLO|nr:26S proteasome non-ATPase regulatory subunit 11-like protein [Micractinium conductrix]|eukprot:PSC67714.1 26S proteasome non-ATPase regulatory subunit 11-like protein [Micractinium conductrix]